MSRALTIATGAILSALAPVAVDAGAATYVYAVTHPRYGRIGSYAHTIDEFHGTTRAQAHLAIAVKVLGVTVYRQSADQTEVWRGGRLASFDGKTTINGRRTEVRGEARDDRFLVTTASGTAVAPGDVAASDPWSFAHMGRGTVVSTRTGLIETMDVAGGAVEKVRLRGVWTSARHFRISTPHQKNKWEVWLDSRDVPIKFRSIERGAPIDFTLASAPVDEVPNPLAEAARSPVPSGG